MKSAGRHIALLATVLAGCAGSVRADVGGLVASGLAGPLRASVLVSPTPLRAGPAEWSILLQDADGDAVLDAEIEIELQRHGATGDHAHRVVAPRRETSANRLLYSALVDLPEPGVWKVELRVTRPDQGRGQGQGQGTEQGRLAFELPVGPATGGASEHWRALALPAIALGLFALHQWLRLAERRGRRRRPKA